MKNSKKVLYENIMTSVAKEVKKVLNEENISNRFNSFARLSILGHMNQEISVERLLGEPSFLRKIAGYIVEEHVKRMMKFLFSHNEGDYVDGGNNWWDFELNGEKVEVKAFQKGRMYSNVHATKNQVDHKNELVFMLVEYVINGYDIEITGYAFVDGSEIEFDSRYNRLVNNGNIQFVRE